MKKIHLALLLSLLSAGASAQVNYDGTAPVAGDQACLLNTIGQITDCANIGTASISTTIRSGTFASRPSASLGLLYQATDLGTNGCLLISNGTYWKPATGACILVNDSSAHTAAGSATEINENIVTIPAGLVSANGSLRVFGTGAFTGTTGAKTLVVRHSATSGDTSGGTAILNSGCGGTATTLTVDFEKVLMNVASQSVQRAGQSANCYIGAASSSAILAGSVNMANVSYLNFNAIGNALDTVGYKGEIVQWIEP